MSEELPEWKLGPGDAPMRILEDPFVPPETRVLLVKPGDVLVISRIGEVPDGLEGAAQWAAMIDALAKGLQGFGIYPVLFEGDVDIAAVRDGAAQWNPDGQA
jgi:hypothetical protein